jgi:carboxyl-terminal processing protease
VRRQTSTAIAALLVVAALLLGIVIGGHPTVLPGFVRNTLVGDKETRVVREAIDKVHDDYYRKVPESALADAAIAGVVRSLNDRFSRYFDPAAYRRFKDLTHNRYEGVGMDVARAKLGLRVVDVFDGSPAKRAGIRKGDVILAAAGKPLAGRSVDDASNLIKGPPGTDVKLRVRHGGRVHDLTVERASVTVPVVASALHTVAGRKLGVLRLATFSSGAHAEVADALKKLKKRGAQGFVFDLRANGGGFVDEAQLIASLFLKGGTIVTTKGRSVPSRTLKAKGTPLVPDAPLVVLVDRDTASASEIVTGALQDRSRAKVVGTRTFGKGVFQEVLELSNGGALDITAGQYFTPKGRNLGGAGVKTGAGIAPNVAARDLPKTRRDEALDKALHVVAGETK